MVPVLNQKLAIDHMWLMSRMACPPRYGLSAMTSQQRQPYVFGKTGVAVIPIYGVLAQRESELMSWFGGSSTNAIASAIVAAINNPGIDGVILDIDSPGGSTYGAEELAELIRDAAKIKPIFAIANSRAMSAAYWIGSAVGPDRFFAAPGSDVGSIGVFVLHEDISGMLEMDGIKVSCIHAGENKAELLSCTALSAEARAHLQLQVDVSYSAFVSDVALGRAVSDETVRRSFGGGRFYDASIAESMGMIDGIRTMRTLVSEVSKDHDMDEDEMMRAQMAIKEAWQSEEISGTCLSRLPAARFFETVKKRSRRLRLANIN